MLRLACNLAREKNKRGKLVNGPRNWGRMHNISKQYVSDVLGGNRAPGEKITKALGLIPKEGWERMPLNKLPKHLWELHELMGATRYDE